MKKISAQLVDDPCYKTLLEKTTTFPYRYHTEYKLPAVVPQSSCDHWTGGCTRQFYRGGVLAPIESEAFMRPTRVGPWSRRTESTELFGTSAYKGLSRSGADDVATTTQLRKTMYDPSACAKWSISETPYDRFDCVNFPLVTEKWQRGGVSSRTGVLFVEGSNASCK